MNIVLILIGHRVESAVKVQSILTANGDIIKTRLGLNRELSQDSQASGFVFLEICGDKPRIEKLCNELNSIEDVRAEYVSLSLAEGSSC
ncbi:Uncharacterized [Syntrophomonas zehnderi OL-4]|uniref:Uncharacterized n=1 Tax=Syntrophomonas zehnderi OL-4 TaxID=690567 RepID=A0A0E4C831_9FIRM|nr:hypothetical protein [Syntrophomonas zehnderi]CFX21308.1 Uncharacterized [Syntrophomonas zehnderi OL-4]